MQKPSPLKRAAITTAAAKLFATLPFHQVRLGDIAAAAGVGKGTLYVYFDSKEDLFFALIEDGFAGVVAGLGERIKQDQGPALPALATIVRELVAFAVQHPYLFEIMRSVGGVKLNAALDIKRTELTQLIEQTLRRGVRRGEIHDPNPELTALCVPGLVRSVYMFGPKGLDAEKVAAQLVGLLEHGVAKKAPA